MSTSRTSALYSNDFMNRDFVSNPLNAVSSRPRSGTWDMLFHVRVWRLTLTRPTKWLSGRFPCASERCSSSWCFPTIIGASSVTLLSWQGRCTTCQKELHHSGGLVTLRSHLTPSRSASALRPSWPTQISVGPLSWTLTPVTWE